MKEDSQPRQSIHGLTALVDLSARALHKIMPSSMARPALEHLLYDAIDRDDVEATRNALAMGADPSAMLRYASALHKAISNERWAIALVLLDAGANPNFSGPDENHGLQPPLHLACAKFYSEGSQEVVRALIDRGAEVDAFDKEGLRPIDHAQGDEEMLLALLGAGVDINRLNLVGDAPLHRMLRRASGGLLSTQSAELAKVLIEFGADPLLPEGEPAPGYGLKVSSEYRARGQTPLEIVQDPGFFPKDKFDWLEPLVRAEQARRSMQAIAKMGRDARAASAP